MTSDPPAGPEQPPASARPALSHVDVGDGPLVTMVHGFAETRGCWGPLVDRLAASHRCRLVDAPGHGGSHATRADLWESGRLLLDVAEDGVLLGYSMGARMALHAALLDASHGTPALSGLVLISGTAGIDVPEDRAERQAADARLARRIEEIGVPAFIDEWLAGPLFAGLPEWARFEAERRTNTPEGLAASLRDAGTGQQDPLWSRLPEIEVLTLVVTGSHDPKFTDLGRRMAMGVPRSTHAEIPGGGHSAHLEAWPATAEAIESFLG